MQSVKYQIIRASDFIRVDPHHPSHTPPLLETQGRASIALLELLQEFQDDLKETHLFEGGGIEKADINYCRLLVRVRIVKHNYERDAWYKIS